METYSIINVIVKNIIVQPALDAELLLKPSFPLVQNSKMMSLSL